MLGRRRFVAGAGLAALLPARAADTGGLPAALPAPGFVLTLADGRRTTLPAALQGGLGVVQLMFTGCTTVCSPQGLLFATLAARDWPAPVHFLSISIDTLGDDPARLRAWQAKLGAAPAWQAAVAEAGEVDRLAAWLRGAPVKPGTHNAQVFVFDARARLVRRTADLPSAAEVSQALLRVAAGEA